MPTHREDFTPLSLSQLADLTGHKPETIRKRLEGLAPEKVDGRTRWYATRPALARIYGAGDLDRERSRLAKEQADRIAMENAEARGELVKAAHVESWLVRLLSGVVVRLRAIPAKAAPEAHGAASIAEVEKILRRHQNEILDEIAEARWIAPPRAESEDLRSDSDRSRRREIS